MWSQFGAGTLVEYAGSQWRVRRALGVEAVLLRSDTGEEVAADLRWSPKMGQVFKLGSPWLEDGPDDGQEEEVCG